MGYLLGIDGGGTRTMACVADDRLSILSCGQAGPSNPVKVGAVAAQQEIARACRRALRAARVRPSGLNAVCVGLAGGGSASIQRCMLGWLRKEIPAGTHRVTTDAAILLASALGAKEGAIVIAGTGSIAYGRGPHGRTLQVGGWGSLYDDAGSGYDIGRRAIVAALRAHDGRSGPTRLTRSLCRRLHLGSIIEVIAKPLTPQQIAALFPLVQHEARAGDAVARSLCRNASLDLAELALTIIHQLGCDRLPVRVICSGGVFQSSGMIRRAFTRLVHESAPQARVSLLRRDPVEGALRLARQLVQTQTAGHAKA